ncbi:MAG: TetR/AcrR family transcriptional regulator [Pseudomonadota bacterium]
MDARLRDTAPEAQGRKYRPQETRAHILTAAKELFRTQGYTHTSSLEIAQRADVAEGSVFYHFGSKANLLAALGAEYAREKVAAMRGGETDLSKLEPGLIIARTFGYVRDHGMMLANTGLKAGSPELQPFLHANRIVIVDFVSQCMAASGPQTPSAEEDPEKIAIKASLSYAVVVDALQRVYESEEPEDEAKVMAVTIQFVRDACGYGHLTHIPPLPLDEGVTDKEPAA